MTIKKIFLVKQKAMDFIKEMCLSFTSEGNRAWEEVQKGSVELDSVEEKITNELLEDLKANFVYDERDFPVYRIIIKKVFQKLKEEVDKT